MEPIINVWNGQLNSVTTKLTVALSRAPKTGNNRESFLPVISLNGAIKDIDMAAGTSPDTLNIT